MDRTGSWIVKNKLHPDTPPYRIARRTFHFRVVTNTLPDHKMFRTFDPALYEGIKCPRCRGVETDDTHYFSTCPGVWRRTDSLWADIVDTIHETTTIGISTINKEIQRWIPKKGEGDERKLMWFLGRIPITLREWLKKRKTPSPDRTKIHQNITQLTIDATLDIWKARCKENAEQRLDYASIKSLRDAYQANTEEVLLIQDELCEDDEDIIM
eukprot:TRINITY_DN16814_c0_g1_i1.p1 TRINITY_DN16814_c0_g1~~TRINITY_DN16814_c0_g1_i1.p1  ORF type:complete len:212 (+),score=31.70 TRINITY_DN16814_c0_g1_i1:107-742(+)